jgi:sirohydrochlorin cobaltochelatase
MAAFGASSSAHSTYRDIDKQIQQRFPGYPVYWAFSARGGGRNQSEQKEAISNSVSEVLRTIARQGYKQTIVQAMHLLPGKEFHQLILECRKIPITCHPGMPVLFTPEDYQKLADCLAPSILCRPDKAILLIGHGTSHPSWVAYLALERILRRRFGHRIFVGVIEKYPDSETIPAEIAAAGFRQVCIIPLLMAAGMHYHRDIIGSDENSWLRRLQGQGLEVESIDQGLGLQPGFCNILLDHTADALRLAEKQVFSS